MNKLTTVTVYNVDLDAETDETGAIVGIYLESWDITALLSKHCFEIITQELEKMK